MSTNPLKTNNDFFTEEEIDFPKTFGKLIYLDKKEVSDYQNVTINSETGEILPHVLIDEDSGKMIEGTIPEGIQAEIRSRPIEGTLVAYDLILESEALGMPIEITVPSTVKVDTLTYNQEVKLVGLTARHWSRNTRQVNGNGQVSYAHTQGFKIRAEGIQGEKIPAKNESPKLNH